MSHKVIKYVEKYGYETGFLLLAIFVSFVSASAGEGVETYLVGWITNSDVSFSSQWGGAYARRDGTYFYQIEGQDIVKFFLPVYLLVLSSIMYIVFSVPFFIYRCFQDRKSLKIHSYLIMAAVLLFLFLIKMDKNHIFLTTLT